MDTTHLNARFGFLPLRWSFHFDGGKVVPLDNFTEGMKWIKTYRNRDSFLYAPIQWNVDDAGKKIPNSESPASLFHVPASHEIHLTESDPKREKAGFIMHLLALLGGWRLQFEDWWVDSRLLLRDRSPIVLVPQTAQDCVLSCVKTWISWPQPLRNNINTLLFIHSRIPGYQWPWERFMHEYMVLDGLHAIARKLKKLPKAGHADRINQLCDAYGIPKNPQLIPQVVKLRNDLFHQAIWADGQPCNVNDGEAVIADTHLRRLSKRLILAMLGFENDFAKSPWWYMGSFHFGPVSSGCTTPST